MSLYRSADMGKPAFLKEGNVKKKKKEKVQNPNTLLRKLKEDPHNHAGL